MKSQVLQKSDGTEGETLQEFSRSSVFVIRNSPNLRWDPAAPSGANLPPSVLCVDFNGTSSTWFDWLLSLLRQRNWLQTFVLWRKQMDSEL
ncbi:uncharacterized protein LOC131960980 isoform X1 [Centropristis striata]|uniref:uncharacterized protein LOC131960980 isoform X1 n=1 Tax=Centropristis striata TaxID=184440 RepID=UPI0027E1C715|nr:uncharacterized protein LOC131960980 isoform X1 [Centropristis striata]